MAMQNETGFERRSRRKRDGYSSKNGKAVSSAVHQSGEAAKPPYRYTLCGLDDVYLMSGYEIKVTEHGRVFQSRMSMNFIVPSVNI
jgi:hypothetical protein